MERVKAVIFDWAGTVIDYGSLAPMGAFVETFGEFGVSISIDEARGPMGMAKRPHIAALMSLPRVAKAWADRHGRAPTEADIDAVYAAFVPKNIAVAARYATLIPGASEVATELRSKGIKIGSSTGYTTRSWPRSCRSLRRRASSPTVSFAPATRPTDGRRLSCFTRRCSTRGLACLERDQGR